MKRTYPNQPVIGVAGIVIEGDRVLLVQRGHEPQKGKWSVPGGALEVGETISEGVRRELREETGLEVQVGRLVEVFERISERDDEGVRHHYVILDYMCEPCGGELAAGGDAADARWVGRNELASYTITPGTPAVIEKAFRMSQG